VKRVREEEGERKEEGAGGRREMSTPLNLNSASAPDKKLAVDTVFVCSVISRSNFLDLPSSKFFVRTTNLLFMHGYL